MIAIQVVLRSRLSSTQKKTLLRRPNPKTLLICAYVAIPTPDYVDVEIYL